MEILYVTIGPKEDIDGLRLVNEMLSVSCVRHHPSLVNLHRWVIDLAADRQVYIDQAQSLNLFFRPDVHIKYLHACHFLAWKKGLKTLYYCRSEKLAKADKVSKRIEREVIKELDMSAIAQGNECLACEG